MNYKYKLIEQEEESSALKGLRAQNELILTTKGGLKIDDIIKVLNDPKNLEGTFAVESKDLEDIMTKVFGDRPNIVATTNVNKEIFKNNGVSLYKEIEEVTGQKLDKRKPNIKKDKEGKVLFAFLEVNKYNKDIVEKYFALTSEKQGKRSSLNYRKADEFTLKFPVGDEANLKKILKKSGLEANKDYSLEKKEISENLRETIKNILRKTK